VTSVEAMLAVLRAGYSLRATAATAANDVSSRSHTVFTVSVVTYRGDNQQPVTGRLNLVDLAGSERQSKSGAEGQRLKVTSVEAMLA
ncbi:Kinesin-like protein KIF17, partial [Tetrabaena socialis]